MSTPAILTVPIENPDGLNLVLGQAHFIKTVEDLYEALAGSSPHLRPRRGRAAASSASWTEKARSASRATRSARIGYKR